MPWLLSAQLVRQKRREKLLPQACIRQSVAIRNMSYFIFGLYLLSSGVRRNGENPTVF